LNELLFWVLFNVFILAMLALDLGVLHRNARVPTFRRALMWSGMWIAMAAIFAFLISIWQGHAAGLEFVTGYVIELSLSVDNLFIFLLIFQYFRVPTEHQHRVLFWGVLGALVMRALFILAGVGLIRKFHWIIYFFGALLLYSGIKLARERNPSVNPEKNPVLRALRSLLPVTDDYEGGKFFVRRPHLFATPLLVVLLVIETTDVIFAVDSIPAILAITLNAFVVYTSNVFAILGLRSMYFALVGMMKMFHYLHYGLAVVLMFVGGKMLVSHYFNIPTVWALVTVAGVLLTSVLASMVYPQQATN
jgi:tellurite resistance protein TerC